MGFFRFRRSFKIFPGVRLNLGKKSTSLSIGGRGARYTFGTAGSRTTIGIPGTGLSYTDIHRSHKRGSQRHAGIPLPSEEWVQSHMVDQPIHVPDRGKNERPIRQDQIDELNSLKNVNLRGYDIHSLGSEQARKLIIQIEEQQREVSKALLKKFYADHGHAVPDDFIDHCYDHPNQPYQASKKWGYGTWFVIGIVLWVVISLLNK